MGCSEEAPASLRLGSNIWPGYEPLYLARDLGYFDNRNIKLVEYVSSRDVIRGFRNGSIDAAALTLDEVLLLLESGIRVKIILITDFSNGGDVLLARKAIETMSDLRGKKVGVEGNALGAYMLTRALEINKLPIGGLNIINLEVDEHEAAFVSGQLDAVVTFEPVRTRLLANGAHEIFSSREIPGEIVDVIVVRAESVAPLGKQITDLVRGWFQAVRYLEDEPEAAAGIIDLRLKIGPEKVIKAYEGLTIPTGADNILFLTRHGDVPPALDVAVRRLYDVMVTHGLIRKDMQIGELYLDEIPGLKEIPQLKER